MIESKIETVGNLQLRDLRDVGLCLVSVVLSVASFSDLDAGYLAWAALVPLFWMLANRGLAGGFLFAFAWGVCFFLGIFSWILEIPYYRWYHHGLLAIYLGSYIGFFGLGFVFLQKRLGRPQALWAASLLWVALEYIRGNLSFLALPWGFIAHTQYPYPMLIQCVSVVGTYGLGLMVILVNAGIVSLIFKISSYWKPERVKKGDKIGSALTILAGLCFLVNLAYGLQRIDSKSFSGTPISMALIQGNIAQSKKWDPRFAAEIMETYSSLTLHASTEKPDLIVWPETAAPGSIIEDKVIYDNLKNLVRKSKTPMILGSAQYQKFQEAEAVKIGRVNSAFLMSFEDLRDDLQQYDKIRLFPFGEYLPYKEILPWKWIRVSSLGDYVPGKEYTVFKLPPHRFAVTICWENIFPDLVRQFVKKGAQFIINITNEARFGKTAAPYQLLAINVFRAVENGVFVVRCANTGISCIIDPYGRIVRKLQDDKGQDLFIRGFVKEKIVSLDSKTFYTRYGDMVPIGSIASVAALMILALRKSPKGKKRKNHFDSSR